MTERERLNAKIKENESKIQDLNKENLEIYKQTLLLSDDKQWFTEEIESHPRAKWQRYDNELDGKLVGRINWSETFKDEDYPNDRSHDVTVKRSQIVRICGEFV